MKTKEQLEQMIAIKKAELEVMRKFYPKSISSQKDVETVTTYWLTKGIMVGLVLAIGE